MEHLELVDKVFGYYEKYGNQNYIGEKVTQLEHATQCAMLAEQEGHPKEVSKILYITRRPPATIYEC